MSGRNVPRRQGDVERLLEVGRAREARLGSRARMLGEVLALTTLSGARPSLAPPLPFAAAQIRLFASSQSRALGDSAFSREAARRGASGCLPRDLARPWPPAPSLARPRAGHPGGEAAAGLQAAAAVTKKKSRTTRATEVAGISFLDNESADPRISRQRESADPLTPASQCDLHSATQAPQWRAEPSVSHHRLSRTRGAQVLYVGLSAALQHGAAGGSAHTHCTSQAHSLVHARAA